LYTLTCDSSFIFGFLRGNLGYPSFHHPCAFFAVTESCPRTGDTDAPIEIRKKTRAGAAFRERRSICMVSVF
jgi:hypothetical protein